MSITKTRFLAPVAAGASFACLALAACGGGASNTAAAANAAAPPAAPPAANVAAAAPAAPTTVHFVNTPANAQAPALAGHFVDFSFDYPSDWAVDPYTGTQNTDAFIQISHSDAQSHVMEQFNVASLPTTGSASTDQDMLPRFLQKAESMLQQADPGYRRVDMTPTTFAGWPAAQLRYTIAHTNSTGEIVPMYGRIVLVPGMGGSNGIAVNMMVTSRAGYAHNVDDVGTKGPLGAIVSSFKIGK